MRLLRLDILNNNATFKFEDFYDDPPDYAIFSHTWEEDEISYQNARDPNTAMTDKKGYVKILAFANLALTDGYLYGWVDTCCIDKTNLTELTETINSMFRWYETSARCYAYLCDVPQVSAVPPEELNNYLAKSKWFTRGWTMQELIAPSHIVLYNQVWEPLGSKDVLATTIAEITDVDQELLRHNRQLPSYTIAERMSWAARRKTTRPEDIAYSMLGLFSINMPLLYGEGSTNAFFRLQEEIIKRSTDHTLLAWDHDEASFSSVLAPSPRYFASGSERLERNVYRDFPYERVPYELTNMGLRIRLPVIRATHGESAFYLAVLDCYTAKNNRNPKCIGLRCVSDDGNQFERIHCGDSFDTSQFMGCPCLVMNIFIRHGLLMEVSKLNRPHLNAFDSIWSTTSIQQTNVSRMMGSTGEQLGDFHASNYDRQFLFAAVVLILLISSCFRSVATLESGLRDSMIFVLSSMVVLYYLHPRLMYLARLLYQAARISSQQMISILIRKLDHRWSQTGCPRYHSTNLRDIMYCLIVCRAGDWAYNTRPEARRWQHAPRVDVFSHDSLFGLGKLDLRPPLVLYYVQHVPYWWRTAWLYAILFVVLQLAYSFSLHIISYFAMFEGSRWRVLDNFVTVTFLLHGSSKYRLWMMRSRRMRTTESR